MKHISFRNWNGFKVWAEQAVRKGDSIFRGQSDTRWEVTTSLARHYWSNRGLNSDEWRDRELKAYRLFRDYLNTILHGTFRTLHPLEIMALMQHHHLPTRLLDFTFCPFVAAFFAIQGASSNSAIFVVKKRKLREISLTEAGDRAYRPWPTHMKTYERAIKDDEDPALFVSEILNLRLRAQKGCFLVPGHISGPVHANLIEAKVELSEDLIFEGIRNLNGMGIDRESLFPNLDQIAKRILPFLCGGQPG